MLPRRRTPRQFLDLRVDSLAKKSGVPSERLRGGSRADNASRVIGSAAGPRR
jgi:hypothetical protein